MCSHLKLYSFFIICLVVNTANGLDYGVFQTKEDKPYKIVNFKISQALWEQAFNPTPLLKSPVTIVVPIYVGDEEENEVEEVVRDDVTEINVMVNNTMVKDEVAQDPVASAPVVPVVADPAVPAVPAVPAAPAVPAVPAIPAAPAAPTATPAAPVLADPSQEVQGQVIRFPCRCENGQCGCCTGSILDRMSMKACGNITFVPEDFVFDVRLSVNNNTIVRRRVSASDPPPICFNPRRAPFVRVCAEISNIRIRNRNAHACLDINADIGGFQVYSASFRCFSLGSAGLHTGLKPKPVSSGPKPVSLFQNNDNNDNNGGTILDAAQNIIQGQGGLFGGGGGSGPFGNIGQAFGNIFGGRDLN